METSGVIHNRRIHKNGLQGPEQLDCAPVMGKSASGELEHVRGFHEIWRLRLNDLSGKKALLLHFHLLASRNGFRQIAEIWAVLFRLNDEGHPRIDALKQSFNLKKGFSTHTEAGREGLSLEGNILVPTASRGAIASQGKEFEWDLSFLTAQESSFNLVPATLRKLRLSQMRATTVYEDLRVSGTTRVIDRATKGGAGDSNALRSGEEEQIWGSAHGSLSHQAGPKHWNSWVWAQCNSFSTEKGDPSYVVFEGLSFEKKLPTPVPMPRLNSFYFFYRGQHYRFNSLWRAIRSRSNPGIREWEFQVEEGEISFRGSIRADNRDFIAVSLEDTDGSLIYLSQTLLADLTLWIYRGGKLETTLKCEGNAALELASRTRNPYLSLAF